MSISPTSFNQDKEILVAMISTHSSAQLMNQLVQFFTALNNEHQLKAIVRVPKTLEDNKIQLLPYEGQIADIFQDLQEKKVVLQIEEKVFTNDEEQKQQYEQAEIVNENGEQIQSDSVFVMTDEAKTAFNQQYFTVLALASYQQEQMLVVLMIEAQKIGDFYQKNPPVKKRNESTSPQVHSLSVDDISPTKQRELNKQDYQRQINFIITTSLSAAALHARERKELEKERDEKQRIIDKGIADYNLRQELKKQDDLKIENTNLHQGKPPRRYTSIANKKDDMQVALR